MKKTTKKKKLKKLKVIQEPDRYLPNVAEARYLGDHRVQLKFTDGLRGSVDLANELDGPVFVPLRDPGYFAKFELDGWTLTWDCGADFAPEFLYEKVKNTDTEAARSQQQ
jgi:hypothetical protein